MDDARDTVTTELTPDVDAPEGESDPVETPESPAGVGPVAASYAVRIHARRIDGYPDAVEPTLDEVQEWIAGAFGRETEGFTVSVRAERVDR